MTGGPAETTRRDIDRLFGAGTVAGLTDPELLEEFVAHRDEVAFAAIVSRHGPMVLGVCRGVLRNETAAEDAFQATFLVLLRQAHTLRVRRSLAGWLSRVAFRIAARADSDSRKQRQRDRRAAEMKAAAATDPGQPELGPLLEEVDRLPERYRIPVVLCGLEGLTHNDAARSLGWPVGTVSGRLSRARELLRARLTRRGVALPAGLLAGAISAGRADAVPPSLASATLESALRMAANRFSLAGVTSDPVARLAKGAIRDMLVTRMMTLAAATLSAAAIGVVGAVSMAQRAAPADQGAPRASAGASEGKRKPDGATSARVLASAYEVVKAAESDPYRVYTLVDIARAQARLGEREAALKTLVHAAEVADTLKPGTRATAIGAIAYGHWEAGDRGAIPKLLQGALKDADRVEDDSARIGVLAGVGTDQAWTGDLTAARESVRRMLEIANASQRPNDRFFRLLSVVSLQAQVGDFDDALRVVDSMKSTYEQSHLLGQIAEAAASANHYFLQPPRELTPTQKPERVALMHRIVRTYLHSPVEVAMALADLGNTEEGLKLCDVLHDADVKRRRGDNTALPWVLSRIATAQTKAGHPDDARTTLEYALRLAREQPEVKGRLGQIADAQVEAGDIAGALRTVDLIPAREKSRILIEVAKAQQRAGEKAASLATLRAALADAKQCLESPPPGQPGTLGANPAFWKSRAAPWIAEAQARLGDFAAALATAKEAPGDGRRPAFAKVAELQAGAGQAEEVLAWARHLDNPGDRTAAMGGLARGTAPNEVKGRR